MECELVLGAEAFRICRQIGRKLLIARLGCGHVLGEKFHLLPDAAANDDVVALQAGGSALAVEDLVADIVLDQALQFLLTWRPSPRSRKSVAEVGDPRGGYHDSLGRVRVSLAREAVEREQHRTKREELE